MDDPYDSYLRTVEPLLEQLGGPSDRAFPTDRMESDDDPALYVQRDPLALVTVERGVARIEPMDSVEALVFEVLWQRTFGMASSWELAHRRSGEDSRRLLFARQRELMQALGSPWVERLAAKLDAILAAHPFDDLLARRAERWDALMKAGLRREDAVREATLAFPPTATPSEPASNVVGSLEAPFSRKDGPR